MQWNALQYWNLLNSNLVHIMPIQFLYETQNFKLNVINFIKNNWDVFGIKHFCVMLYLIISVNIAQSNEKNFILFNRILSQDIRDKEKN